MKTIHDIKSHLDMQVNGKPISIHYNPKTITEEQKQQFIGLCALMKDKSDGYMDFLSYEFCVKFCGDDVKEGLMTHDCIDSDENHIIELEDFLAEKEEEKDSITLTGDDKTIEKSNDYKSGYSDGVYDCMDDTKTIILKDDDKRRYEIQKKLEKFCEKLELRFFWFAVNLKGVLEKGVTDGFNDCIKEIGEKDLKWFFGIKTKIPMKEAIEKEVNFSMGDFKFKTISGELHFEREDNLWEVYPARSIIKWQNELVEI